MGGDHKACAAQGIYARSFAEAVLQGVESVHQVPRLGPGQHVPSVVDGADTDGVEARHRLPRYVDDALQGLVQRVSLIDAARGRRNGRGKGGSGSHGVPWHVALSNRGTETRSLQPDAADLPRPDV